MIKAYAFDFEGTLVDFQWDLDPGMKATREKLEEMGFDREKLSKTQSYAKVYNDAVIDAFLRRVSLSAAEVREKLGEVWDVWDLDAATRWTLRENTRETLQSLHQRATVGLMSSVGQKAIVQLLRKYDVERFFHILVTREDTILIKPFDDGLRLILNVLQISPEEMLFIGDSEKDVAAAKGVGARSAFIVGGEAELSPDVKPDYVIHSLSEILEIK